MTAWQPDTRLRLCCPHCDESMLIVAAEPLAVGRAIATFRCPCLPDPGADRPAASVSPGDDAPPTRPGARSVPVLAPGASRVLVGLWIAVVFGGCIGLVALAVMGAWR